MDHPLIKGGGSVLCAYKIGGYKAVLVKQPESVGPIEYLFVMIVSDIFVSLINVYV